MFYALLIDRRIEEEAIDCLPEYTIPPTFFESREELEEFFKNLEFPDYLFAHHYLEGDLDAKFAQVRKDLLFVTARPDEYQIVYADHGGLRLSSVAREPHLRRVYEARIDALVQAHKNAAQEAVVANRERAIRTIRELKERYGIE